MGFQVRKASAARSASNKKAGDDGPQCNRQLPPTNWALGPAFRVNPHYKSCYFSHILYQEWFQPVPARNCCLVAFSRDNSDWAPAITRAPNYK
jgi:hypothetical protein